MATLPEIAAFRPQDIDEALDAMCAALDYFHRENDRRAVFLRAYYLITIAVHQAVHGRGPYSRRVFFDAGWIKRLAGKFASLYFQSLTTETRPGERAWKLAHRMAATGNTSVFQDMLLGLNAHINYDLAYGIYLNMKEFDDERDSGTIESGYGGRRSRTCPRHRTRSSSSSMSASMGSRRSSPSISRSRAHSYNAR
jgi:hypothetical protein